MTRADVVTRYRKSLAGADAATVRRLRQLLGGYDLACWCRLDQGCHADVLLDVANGTSREVWNALHPDNLIPPHGPEPDEHQEDDW